MLVDIITAVDMNDIGAVRTLLASGSDVNTQQSSDGNSLLHVAAHHGHTEMIEVLLTHGADVDIVDSQGQTALYQLIKHRGPAHIALSTNTCKAEMMKSLTALVNAGSDVNTVGKDGSSLVSLLLDSFDYETLQYFLSVGLNLHTYNAHELVNSAATQSLKFYAGSLQNKSEEMQENSLRKLNIICEVLPPLSFSDAVAFVTKFGLYHGKFNICAAMVQNGCRVLGDDPGTESIIARSIEHFASMGEYQLFYTSYSFFNLLHLAGDYIPKEAKHTFHKYPQEFLEFYKQLQSNKQRCLSLQELSRIVIRRSITCPLKKSLAGVGLPKSLQQYVTFTGYSCDDFEAHFV